MPTHDKSDALALARELVEWASRPHQVEDEADDELTAQMRVIRENTLTVCRALIALSAASPCKEFSKGHATDACGNCGQPHHAHASSVADTVDVEGLLASLKDERDPDVLFGCFETALRKLAPRSAIEPPTRYEIAGFSAAGELVSRSDDAGRWVRWDDVEHLFAATEGRGA